MKRNDISERDWGRFLSKVIQSGDDQCWGWTDTNSMGGYGVLRIGSRKIKAHRLSYVRFVGDLADDSVIRHKCDNPGCVNPSHLIPGSQKDNAADRKERGREGKHHGRLNGRAVLYETDVLDIRGKASAGEQLTSIAREYGLTKQAIWRIVHRVTWVHI